MDRLTTERARELLGGINGHDLLAAHANRRRTIFVTRPRDFWSGLLGKRRERESRPGMRLIGSGAVLLVLLGAGLLAVSYAAQYRYVLDERGQVPASLIEAGALDVGMIIFSLIALGLAIAGLASKTERAAIIACAVASAVMNFAPADSASWRSVLAWTMPPVFLAFVVDRVVSAVRRHVLGMRNGVSPWRVAATGAGKVARFTGMAALYVLRFALAPPSTAAGARRAVLAATPLPDLPPRPVLTALQAHQPAVTGRPADWAHASAGSRRAGSRPARSERTGTKTALLIERVTERYGLLAAIEPDQVSQIANTLAPEVDLHPASARTALLKAVRAAQAEGDAR